MLHGGISLLGGEVYIAHMEIIIIIIRFVLWYVAPTMLFSVYLSPSIPPSLFLRCGFCPPSLSGCLSHGFNLSPAPLLTLDYDGIKIRKYSRVAP